MAKVQLLNNNFKKWTASLDGINAGYTYAELLEVVEDVIENLTRGSVAKLFEYLQEDMLRLSVGVFSNFEDFSKGMKVFIREINKIDGMCCKRRKGAGYIIADANSGELYGSIKLEMVPVKGGRVPVLTLYLIPDAGNYCY